MALKDEIQEQDEQLRSAIMRTIDPVQLREAVDKYMENTGLKIYRIELNFVDVSTCLGDRSVYFSGVEIYREEA